MDNHDRYRIIRFLKSCQGYLENENFKDLYELANTDFETSRDIGFLTQVLLDANINPLDYLDYVPQTCFYGLDMFGFDLPKHITSIDKHAFAYTKNLKIINLNNINYIDENCFTGSSLEEVLIPESIEVIPPEAFYNCYSLRRVLLSEGVEYINDSAFRDCSTLKELYLPSTVVYIHEHAFYGDRQLSDIYYNSTKENLIKIWENLEGLRMDYTIHCSDGDIKL